MATKNEQPINEVVMTPEEALEQLESVVEEQKTRTAWIATGCAVGGVAIGVGLGWLLFGRN